MPGTPNETGHYKNVANFKKLCTHVQTFAKYNPAREVLKLPNLLAQHEAATTMMTSLNTAETNDKKAAKERAKAFYGFSEFATSIVSELESAVPDSHLIPQAHHILAKIRGTRIGKFKEEPPTPPATPTDESAAAGNATDTPADEPNHRSVSQRSFDAIEDHLDKLVTVIEAEPAYVSGVPELQPVALRTYWDDLKQANRTAFDSGVVLTNMRKLRTELLYQDVTGLVPMARAVKKAVVGAYKTNSPEYKQISGISFRDLSDKK